MPQLLMTSSKNLEYSHLLGTQAELLQRARGLIGPLAGTSFFVDEERGWAIRLTVLRAITPEERSSLDDLVASFDSPIFIEERKSPPSLAMANLKPGVSGGFDR